jgi:hypothetical protein
MAAAVLGITAAVSTITVALDMVLDLLVIMTWTALQWCADRMNCIRILQLLYLISMPKMPNLYLCP